MIATSHVGATAALLLSVACGETQGERTDLESTSGQTLTGATSSQTSGATSSTTTTQASTSATGATSSVDDPAAPPETCGHGRFRALGDVSGDYDWTVGSNLIACAERDDVAGWLVRLAEDPAMDGVASLHLELDFYEYEGEGDYVPLPYPQWPPDPRSFDIFLRLPSGAPYYANVPTSTDCTATVAYEDAVWLAGTFSCTGIVYFGTTVDPGRTVDVHDGAFCCEKP